MKKCSYCNSTIIFGGVREGAQCFCNQKCRQSGALLRVSASVSDEEVRRRVLAVHQGPCPKCKQQGIIDVHTAHSVWSAVLMTRWQSRPQVSCAPCGKKAQMIASLSSFFLGWWGFPWGIVFTPIQIGKNISGMVSGPSSQAPSPQLERLVRLSIANALRQQAAAQPPKIA